MNNSIITISPRIDVDNYILSILNTIREWEDDACQKGEYSGYDEEYDRLVVSYKIKHSIENKMLSVYSFTKWNQSEECVYQKKNVKKCGCFKEYKKLYVVHLCDNVLSFVITMNDQYRDVICDTKVIYELTEVREFIISPDKDTIIVYFEDGSFRTFGKLLFDSKRDYTNAKMKYYGRCLEDGHRRVTWHGYSNTDEDIRDNFSGMFGTDTDGRPLIVAHQNYAVDQEWYINPKEMSAIEKLSDIVELDCLMFTTLDKSRTELRAKALKKLYIPGRTVRHFSNSQYYGIFIDNTGHIFGENFQDGCTDFKGLDNAVKAFAFPIGTVVLSDDGLLHNYCDDYNSQAYENLPVTTGVKDIARNSQVFVILCENGDLYLCEKQTPQLCGCKFEVKPFGEWELIHKGIDHIECYGEEILAYPADC